MQCEPVIRFATALSDLNFSPAYSNPSPSTRTSSNHPLYSRVINDPGIGTPLSRDTGIGIGADLGASGLVAGALGGRLRDQSTTDRGREVRLSRTPLPPNRTGGFPAYGSPVSRFLWTERTEHGLLAGYRDPDRRSIPPLTLASKVSSACSLSKLRTKPIGSSRWLHDRYSRKWHCDRYVALCSFSRFAHDCIYLPVALCSTKLCCLGFIATMTTLTSIHAIYVRPVALWGRLVSQHPIYLHHEWISLLISFNLHSIPSPTTA